MGSTCMKILMHAQQSGSCGVQDFENKYCIGVTKVSAADVGLGPTMDQHYSNVGGRRR